MNIATKLDICCISNIFEIIANYNQCGVLINNVCYHMWPEAGPYFTIHSLVAPSFPISN